MSNHLKIYGCYIDIDDNYKKTYLSDTLKGASERVEIEKTFIYPISIYSYKYPNLV